MTTSSPPKTNRQPPGHRLNAGDAVIFLSITLVGAVGDVWSKYAVFRWLEELPTRQYTFIDGFLRFIKAENPGAAFSLFEGMTWLFIAISIVALGVIHILFVLGRLKPRLMLAAVACLNAGILGNLYDRLFNDGRVRDFIDVSIGSYHWPTFNVADSLLCIGVALLVLANLTSPTDQTPARPHKAAS